MENQDKSQNKWFWILLAGGGMALVGLQLFQRQGLPGGTKAPALQVQALAGKKKEAAKSATTSLPSQVTVLHFWATWCGVCVRDLPSALKMAKKLKGEGVSYLFINMDQDVSRRELQAFLKKQGVSSKGLKYHYTDQSNRTASRYHIRSLPTKVVLDPQGKIATYLAGAVRLKTLRQAIQKARQPQKKKSPS